MNQQDGEDFGCGGRQVRHYMDKMDVQSFDVGSVLRKLIDVVFLFPPIIFVQPVVHDLQNTQANLQVF